jgi:competence protein ComGF
MESIHGNKVANQFIITMTEKGYRYDYFQSYDSIIALKETTPQGYIYITLDSTYWNYSRTTSKYRYNFLGESTKETEAKIKSKEYKLDDLN